MIIRTITVFDDITVDNYKDKLKKAALFLKEKEAFLNLNGYELQTKRVASSLFDSVRIALKANDYLSFFKDVNDLCKDLGITFFNPGTLDIDIHKRLVDKIPEILSIAHTINASLRISRNEKDLTMDNCVIAADIFKKIVEVNYQGTFRFSINANCPELIPFYPVSYYKGKDPRYAVGIQLATLVNKELDATLSFDEIFVDLFKKIDSHLLKFENHIINLSDPYTYFGIDTSFAPMVEEKDSIGAAYEKILGNKIGSLGTLSVTAKFTEIMKKLSVMKTGYCGIMLAVLEDSVLAKRFSDGDLDLQKLMFYSTVCACGLDTIPVSSEVSRVDIANIYHDINILSFKHNKPLTARLMSLPNSKPGVMTTFESPYICNTKLLI